MKNNLNRFLLAQESSYVNALSEMKNGRKTSHWMWYIFPQIKGLGRSEMAKMFELEDLNEAVQYLQHPVLGKRLLEICKVLGSTKKKLSANDIFGFPDDVKLRSCLTLFQFVVENNPSIFNDAKYQIFTICFQKFFENSPDELTLKLLRKY